MYAPPVALRNLTIEEMVHLSTPWLDPSGSRKLLAGYARTAPLLDDIAAAHEALLAAQPRAVAHDKELTELLAQEENLDLRHDRLARGSALLLEAMAELSDDRGAFLHARDLLLPDGLAVINRNFAAEAGAAALTRRRLQETPEVAALLEKTPAGPDRKLAEVVNEWLETGRKLGELEVQRIQLEQKSPASPAATSAQRALARNQWGRAVHAMLNLIALDPSPPDAIQTAVLVPVREAEARADQRASRSKKKDPDDQDPGDQNPGG